MEKTFRHVQVPNQVKNAPEIKVKLQPVDYLVYTIMRSYMNKDTYEVFVGIATIEKEYNVNKKTISDALLRLAQNDMLFKTDKKHGRAIIYKIKSLEGGFEKFSYEFLKMDKLSNNEKGILIALQKYMHKSNNGLMATTYTYEKLSELSGFSTRSIKRAFASLSKINALSTLPTKAKDFETGLLKQAKIIDMSAICQAMIHLKEEQIRHDNQFKDIADILDSHNDRFDDINKKIQMLLNDNKELKKKLDEQNKSKSEYSF